MFSSAGPIAAVLCVAALITSAPARAQDARAVDLGVGYQWLDTSDQSYPVGLHVDASGPIFGGLRWLGEATFGRDTEHDREFGVNASLTATTFGGGARWSFGSGGVRPYFQATFGSQRDAYVLSAEGAGDLISETETTLMFQPGGGVALRVTGRWDLFGQADLRRVFYDQQAEDFLRVAAGVRLSFR
jgi:hypothetical protein